MHKWRIFSKTLLEFHSDFNNVRRLLMRCLCRRRVIFILLERTEYHVGSFKYRSKKSFCLGNAVRFQRWEQRFTGFVGMPGRLAKHRGRIQWEEARVTKNSPWAKATNLASGTWQCPFKNRFQPSFWSSSSTVFQWKGNLLLPMILL